MKFGCFAIAGAAMALAWGGAASAASAPLPADVSGYELFLGSPCTINTQSGTCDIAFSGWTGGGGQTANGWTRFPGTRQGLWTGIVSYIGRPQFGGQVDVVSGSFDLLFTDGTVVSGNITGGNVAWPQEGETTACGTDVATVTISIAFTHGVVAGGSFIGCLHDLPAGTVIPPKIWGTLE
jgi:type 1 fimbria pilin